MIRNWRPMTPSSECNIPWARDDNDLFDELPQEKQEQAEEWVYTNIRDRKTVNTNHSSYGLKHILERDTGIYMTNNQFKDLMLKGGYVPVDPNVQNWYYKINIKE